MHLQLLRAYTSSQTQPKEHLSKIETMRPNRSDPPNLGPSLKLSRYSIEQQKLKLNKMTAEDFAQAQRCSCFDSSSVES